MQIVPIDFKKSQVSNLSLHIDKFKELKNQSFPNRELNKNAIQIIIMH